MIHADDDLLIICLGSSSMAATRGDGLVELSQDLHRPVSMEQQAQDNTTSSSYDSLLDV